MSWLKTFVLVLAMLIVGSLAALSVDQTQISLNFLIWETRELSIFWWMLAALLVGLSFGVLAGMWAGMKRRMEMRKLRQKLTQSSAELERLRELTING